VFAQGAGRPLLVGLGLITVLTGLAVSGVLPRTVQVALLDLAVVAVWSFLAFFFRDPERRVGDGIVAPADGRVREVGVEGDRLTISIFMNVSDVHVNRFPIDAHVDRLEEGGRGHRPAYRHDADANVRRTYFLTTAIGPIELVQMTGVLARRLVSFVKAGDDRLKGEKLGMIVLGSRVDVRLPSGKAYPTVVPGDRVRAGVTTIARARS
jgi:phosphatidylserine decarboxylase